MHTTLSPQACPACGTTASRTEPKPQLSDEQWDLIADLFPKYALLRGGGRPPCPPRACMEGILWILRSGARWKDLPKCCPLPATCWRGLQTWAESGLFGEKWLRLPLRLDDLRQIDGIEALADGTFAREKGGTCVGKAKCGKGTKIMVLSDAEGIPLAAEIHSASPAEVTLIESLLGQQPLPKTPRHGCRQRPLAGTWRGADLPTPQELSRAGGSKWPTPALPPQPLKIARLNSWIQNFRRLVVRYDRMATNFLGFVQLACAMIVMRKL